jgi:MFS family permease
LYPFYRVVSVEGVTHALYLLWWVEYKHISPAAVAAILAAGDIAITLLEVPTGRFADRFGHRCSLLAGSALQTAGMLLCWLAEGIPGLILASLCVALGDTFRSGADQALLFESCVASGQPERFQPIEAKSHSLELIALVAMMLTGGVIVETAGFAAAWMLETLLAAVGVALAVCMASPPPTSGHADAGESAPRARAGIRLLWLIAPAALIGGLASATAFAAQTAGRATPMELTLLVSAITLAEAGGAALARHLRADVVTQHLLLSAAALCSAALIIPGAFVAGVVALSLLSGAAEPLRATAIQMLVERRRAEAASWASALDGLVRTLCLLAAGVRSRS